jgi:hypothetical protein
VVTVVSSGARHVLLPLMVTKIVSPFSMSFSTALRKAITLTSKACEIETRWNFLSKNGMDIVLSTVNNRIKIYAKENRLPSFHDFLEATENSADLDEEWQRLLPKLFSLKGQLEQQFLKAVELQTEFTSLIHRSIQEFGFDTVNDTIVLAEMSLLQLIEQVFCFLDGLKMEYCCRCELFERLECPLQRDEGLRISSIWSNQPFLKDNLCLLKDFLA